MFLRVVFIVIGLLFVSQLLGQSIYKESTILMGSSFEITVVADDQGSANKYINTAIVEIKRIESLISSWDQNSQTTKINLNAGIAPIKVDEELIDLIERSITISKVTDGAFDISYASMDKIWVFDGSMETMPSLSTIKQSVAKVGYDNIILDRKNQTVFLKEKGMKIGFGGIGKGYAADKTKALLQSKGVIAGIINASGDMNAWGEQPDGKPWKVAITNPFEKKRSFGLLPLLDKAVVTSGNYEKFVLLNGKRYTHIIDPRTGYPSSGILSVTIFAPKAELADAIATSVFVMGIDAGLDRVNQLKNIECIIIDDKGDVHISNQIKIDKLK